MDRIAQIRPHFRLHRLIPSVCRFPFCLPGLTALKLPLQLTASHMQCIYGKRYLPANHIAQRSHRHPAQLLYLFRRFFRLQNALPRKSFLRRPQPFNQLFHRRRINLKTASQKLYIDFHSHPQPYFLQLSSCCQKISVFRFSRPFCGISLQGLCSLQSLLLFLRIHFPRLLPSFQNIP